MITNLMLELTKPLVTKSWLIALLGVPLLPTPTAQALYIPRTVKQALKNGTRSPDGR